MSEALKLIAATLLSASALTIVSSPANAYTNCTGSEYYVSCTSSEYDYRSNKWVNCYGSGTPGYVTWSCSSY